MRLLLYGELADWYPLLDSAEEHQEEATFFAEAFCRVLARVAGDNNVRRAEPLGSLLELGCGAGFNAFHLKRLFRCTLSDLSPEMLALSQNINPDCEHIEADMKTLRLEQRFDAVFVHDAIVYMTTLDDLRAALTTAFVHTRPGGAAIIAPDFFRETFVEHSETFTGYATALSSEPDRALHCMTWLWDPDPSDTSIAVEYAYLLRENGQVRALHEQHKEGLFEQQTWKTLLEEIGYQVVVIARPIGPDQSDSVFLCKRPSDE
jgi:SAM-dependent methyltransferase